MKRVPKKHQPRGFDILHEDEDLIVGNKAAGMLTVAALWNKTETVHALLNRYVRKGSAVSRKSVYVVHRLDQATTGVLVFAKSEAAKDFLKDHWSENVKTYFTVVHGKLKQKKGLHESHLEEDEDYVVHANADGRGKLARTEYEVVQENEKYSLVKINLLTGRKNQIRVHMSELGNPVVGDAKYGRAGDRFPKLALHSASLELTHPFKKKRMTFEAPLPPHFKQLMG